MTDATPLAQRSWRTGASRTRSVRRTHDTSAAHGRTARSSSLEAPPRRPRRLPRTRQAATGCVIHVLGPTLGVVPTRRGAPNSAPHPFGRPPTALRSRRHLGQENGPTTRGTPRSRRSRSRAFRRSLPPSPRRCAAAATPAPRTGDRRHAEACLAPPSSIPTSMSSTPTSMS